MPLVHLNDGDRSACFLPKRFVYVTSKVEHVNCMECKKTPAYSAKIEKQRNG